MALTSPSFLDQPIASFRKILLVQVGGKQTNRIRAWIHFSAELQRIVRRGLVLDPNFAFKYLSKGPQNKHVGHGQRKEANPRPDLFREETVYPISLQECI